MTARLMDRDELMARALARVNMLREALNLAPLAAMPPGCPGDPEECPVARALPDGFRVGRTHLVLPEPLAQLEESAYGIADAWEGPNPEWGSGCEPDDPVSWMVPLPPILRDFVVDFDDNPDCYPELEPGEAP